MRNFREYSRLISLISSRSVHSSPVIRYYVNIDVYPCIFKGLSFQSKFLAKLQDLYILNQSRKLSVTYGAYAKEKNRGGKKKVGVVKVDLKEMNQYLNVQKLASKMGDALEDMKNDFIKNLTIRSSTGSIEEVIVTFEDKEYCLQELVQVARKPNHVILNASAFPQAISQIIEALSKSGMNLNPQQDGTKIAIPIPNSDVSRWNPKPWYLICSEHFVGGKKSDEELNQSYVPSIFPATYKNRSSNSSEVGDRVTKEHRENLSRNARALFIKCRDNLKDIQNKQLKNLKNNSEISEDVFYRLKAQVEGLCHQHVQEAEKVLKSKQNELLGY